MHFRGRKGHGDAEKGTLENGGLAPQILDPTAQTGQLDEYSNLVRYISTYCDTRKASAGDSVDGDADELVKSKWYAPWRRWMGSKGSKKDPNSVVVPDDWITTDIRRGLSNNDVESRRRKTGWNELTTEKQNLFLKFLSYFTGPILYGMSLV